MSKHRGQLWEGLDAYVRHSTPRLQQVRFSNGVVYLHGQPYLDHDELVKKAKSAERAARKGTDTSVTDEDDRRTSKLDTPKNAYLFRVLGPDVGEHLHVLAKEGSSKATDRALRALHEKPKIELVDALGGGGTTADKGGEGVDRCAWIAEQLRQRADGNIYWWYPEVHMYVEAKDRDEATQLVDKKLVSMLLRSAPTAKTWSSDVFLGRHGESDVYAFRVASDLPVYFIGSHLDAQDQRVARECAYKHFQLWKESLTKERTLRVEELKPSRLSKTSGAESKATTLTPPAPTAMHHGYPHAGHRGEPPHSGLHHAAHTADKASGGLTDVHPASHHFSSNAKHHVYEAQPKEGTKLHEQKKPSIRVLAADKKTALAAAVAFYSTAKHKAKEKHISVHKDREQHVSLVHGVAVIHPDLEEEDDSSSSDSEGADKSSSSSESSDDDE